MTTTSSGAEGDSLHPNIGSRAGVNKVDATPVAKTKDGYDTTFVLNCADDTCRYHSAEQPNGCLLSSINIGRNGVCASRLVVAQKSGTRS